MKGNKAAVLSIAEKCKGAYTTFPSRCVSRNKELQFKLSDTPFQWVVKKDRFPTLRCKSCLSHRLGYPIIGGPNKSSHRIAAFNGSAKNDQSSGSKSAKNPIKISYLKETENIFTEFPEMHDVPVSYTLAIQNLFKNWLTLLHTSPPPNEAMDEALEGSDPGKIPMEPNLVPKEERGNILIAIWGLFWGLNATYPFVPGVSKELTPLWIFGPLITALYMKFFRGICTLYVFAFKQTAKLVKKTPAYTVMAYTYIADGKLKERLHLHLWQPGMENLNKDYEEFSVRMMKEMKGKSHIVRGKNMEENQGFYIPIKKVAYVGKFTTKTRKPVVLQATTILASNWQGTLNTIKADAKGSKEEIYRSKVKYFVKKGRPYICIPENDLHNVNTVIDERGSLAVTSPFPGPLGKLLRALKKQPARVALAGEVVRLTGEKATSAIESLDQLISKENEAVKESTYSVIGVLSSASLVHTSRSENLQELLKSNGEFVIYRFKSSSYTYIDSSGGNHEVDMETMEVSKADPLSPFISSLIDGINQSDARRRALILFCITYSNRHVKDAYMLSADRKGFDVLGKVLGPICNDGSREYQWKEFRLPFKEEAHDMESFCKQLMEMEENALKNVSSFSGLR